MSMYCFVVTFLLFFTMSLVWGKMIKMGCLKFFKEPLKWTSPMQCWFVAAAHHPLRRCLTRLLQLMVPWGLYHNPKSQKIQPTVLETGTGAPAKSMSNPVKQTDSVGHLWEQGPDLHVYHLDGRHHPHQQVHDGPGHHHQAPQIRRSSYWINRVGFALQQRFCDYCHQPLRIGSPPATSSRWNLAPIAINGGSGHLLDLKS
jgi:hypothetical protein